MIWHNPGRGGIARMLTSSQLGSNVSGQRHWSKNQCVRILGGWGLGSQYRLSSRALNSMSKIAINGEDDSVMALACSARSGSCDPTEPLYYNLRESSLPQNSISTGMRPRRLQRWLRLSKDDTSSSGMDTDPSSRPTTGDTNGNERNRLYDVGSGSRVHLDMCCIGAGYVGGPTSAVIAYYNPHMRVTVVDKDASKIRKWKSKHPPVQEPGLRDILRITRDGLKAQTVIQHPVLGRTDRLLPRQPNLFFSTEVDRCIAKADIIFLTVNTPTRRSGTGVGIATDLLAIDLVTESIAKFAKPGTIIVEKSTVPCQTAERIERILYRNRPDGIFEILSNPEFLAEGTAVRDLVYPDRVLIGTLSSPKAAQTLKSVYNWVDPSKILTVNTFSAELAKLAANAMLAQRISSVNSISAICERTGAVVDEVATAIGSDSRLGPKFLKAGLGFGGSCLKKDILSLIYLARNLGLKEVGDYWQQVITMNEFQQNRFVHRVVSEFNGKMRGRKISILGYAFKKNTSDPRESPAIDVVKQILIEQPKEVAIFDPMCNPTDIKLEFQNLVAAMGQQSPPFAKPGGPIEVYNNAYDACKNACATLILTDWDQFRYPSNYSSPALAQAIATDVPETRIDQPRQTATSELDVAARRVNTSSPNILDTDAMPQDGFLPEPDCTGGCLECKRGEEEAMEASQPVDWSRISSLMEKPKWVFDGRGIVDVTGLEALGFKVQAIGRAGSASPLEDGSPGSTISHEDGK